MQSRSRTRGFALVETAVGVAIFVTLMIGIGAILTTTTGLVERSRANLTSSEENRWALDRLGNALRGAAADTLGGFDGSGVATSPTFQTVTGMSAGARVLSSTATLQWQATAAVQGVVNPGEVVLVQDGISVRVAKRVASGGFSVTRRGDSLLVHLETYGRTANGGIANATGDTIVRLRN